MAVERLIVIAGVENGTTPAGHAASESYQAAHSEALLSWGSAHPAPGMPIVGFGYVYHSVRVWYYIYYCLPFLTAILFLFSSHSGAL